MSPTVRMSAEDRREVVIEAAIIEFGLGGYAGTSTEAIARRVGVSQPYLFRLFPNKKALFLACVDRCFDRIQAMWEDAAGEATGEDALIAMGAAYGRLIDDRAMLQIQLQMWATACQDDEVREAARKGMSALWQTAQTISGGDDQRVMQFMAGGMLLNVMAAMDLPRIKDALGETLAGLAAR